MRTNKEITEGIENIIGQVSEVTDKVFGRVQKIKFEETALGADAMENLKLHLGYTKNFSDLAKVRLQYIKFGV